MLDDLPFAARVALLGRPGATAAPYDPEIALGASLLAWWDADHTDLITQAGGVVSAWADRVGGLSMTQATEGARPAYSATGFDGRPCVVFDGTDDHLALASVPFPTADAGAEIWVLADQTEDASSAVLRYAFGYGGQSVNTNRFVARNVTSGFNRARASFGTGAAAITVENTTVELTGRHVVRARYTGTGVSIAVDGGALSSEAAGTPGTGTTRSRIGANTAGTVGNFWNGSIAAVLVTDILDDQQAAGLAAWLTARRSV